MKSTGDLRNILLILAGFSFPVCCDSTSGVTLGDTWKIAHQRTSSGVARLLPSLSIPDDYNKDEVPWGPNGEPVTVNFSINLASILAVDEPNQVISLESTIRLVWYEPRINISLEGMEHVQNNSLGRYIVLNRDPVENLWFPDVFIDKAKDVRVPVYKIPPVYLRVYESRLMVYSARVNYDLSCPMSFENYPVDKQICDVTLESWGHPTSAVIFRWNKADVVVNKAITLNQHDFQVELVNKGDSEYSTGSFTGVTMRLHLTRKLAYHLLRTYLPSILFVTVAWFSMFVPLNHVPGRVAMSMTTMLTLSSMFSSLTTITPPISYTTKLDIWMVSCIVFIFGTLFEFTVVIFLKYYLKHIPAIQLDSVFPSSPGSSRLTGSSTSPRSVTQVKNKIQAWMQGDAKDRSSLVQALEKQRKREKLREKKAKNKEPEEFDDDASESSDDDGDDDMKEMAERVIKRIEKWSVIVYLASLIIFNVVYWWDVLKTYPSSVKNGEIIDRGNNVTMTTT